MEEATMEKERALGVTEARFGLTILICGLVAIGYIVLLRLGSTSQASLEQRYEIESGPRIARKEPKPDESEPTVLPLKPEGSDPLRAAQRPEHSMLPGPVDDNGSTEFQRR
jgi:hypothetical protein